MTEIERKTKLIRLLNGAIHKLIRRNIDGVYITHRLKVKHAQCEQSFWWGNICTATVAGRKKKEGHWTTREKEKYKHIFRVRRVNQSSLGTKKASTRLKIAAWAKQWWPNFSPHFTTKRATLIQRKSKVNKSFFARYINPSESCRNSICPNFNIVKRKFRKLSCAYRQWVAENVKKTKKKIKTCSTRKLFYLFFF